MADTESPPACDTIMGDDEAIDQEKIQDAKPKYKSFRYAQIGGSCCISAIPNLSQPS